MNYTLGKWVYIIRGESVGVAAEDSLGLNFVANCGDPECNKLPCNRDAVANARLISASPDMYEALKAWDNYATANYPKNMKLKRIAWELTDKAIAKAEEKQ